MARLLSPETSSYDNGDSCEQSGVGYIPRSASGAPPPSRRPLRSYGIVKSTKTVAFGRDFTIYALKPGFVKFWWHSVKRKNFVEVVLAPPAPGSAQAAAAIPGVRGQRRHPLPLPAEHKYPIVRVRPWELPGLLALPPDTPIADTVLAQLLAHVRSLNPFQRAALLRGGPRPLIGGLDRLLAEEAAEARQARKATAAAAAVPVPPASPAGGSPATGASGEQPGAELR